ncbi:AbrB/MazE/SpoVT family DNA-binding domain-containing protein [Vulcanisaeta souniana]|uniref:AbrB/MazE/SpoVT family DNA-binding domain-containing protein n=1 Tax=Vulcanisaeta souniana TaxID=164452 RepID=UPI001E374E6A|nr:AbrB/MazE/SpoVT family DNA-binding domain-containing protein [Vulcanisaeta souniana]
MPINELPYTVKIYINNQVLIPANLIKALGLSKAKYADIVIEYNGQRIKLKDIKLLRTRHTDSRQFTIPREIRETYGIRSLDEVIIHEIIPKTR